MRTGLWAPAGLAVAAGSVYAAFAGLSLKIGHEIQPPGGTLQMKLFLTEPKPISTGRGRFAISASAAASVEDVTLFSTAGDAAGAAVVRGTLVHIVCTIPSTVLGSNPDYPLLTVTGRVRTDAALGSVVPLWINPANLVFLDPNGVPYPEEIKAGSLTIAGNVSITDINPGSAAVPAGGVVVIRGLNFTPATTVRMKEAVVSRVDYISPSELHAIVGMAVTMHGQEVTVTNPDGTSAVYYSFQKTTAAGRTGSALFRATLPLFPRKFMTAAAFLLPPDAGTTYSGLAVQNLQSAAAAIRVSLIAADGGTVGQRSFLLPPDSRMIQKAAELVAAAPPAGSHWLLEANAPVQMLGLSGDDSTGVVSPLLPVSVH